VGVAPEPTSNVAHMYFKSRLAPLQMEENEKNSDDRFNVHTWSTTSTTSDEHSGLIDEKMRKL
jgi:hypothetical protein